MSGGAEPLAPRAAATEVKSNGRATRTWLCIYGAGFLAYLALLPISLFTPIPYGDLTRIGRVSETEFGWRKAPPPIPDANIKASPIQDADVLVIGDSFSVRYGWQSVLVGAGYRVATTHWDDTGPLCSDFSGWLAQSGFKGKTVVIESVERVVEERMRKSETCQTMQHPFKPLLPPFNNLSAPAPDFQFNRDAQLFSGWLTYWHTRAALRSARWSSTPDSGGGAQVDAETVPDGCRQFSHQACNKLLVIAEDHLNPPLSAGSAAFMGRFAAQAAPYRVVWMVVPNKSTVYLTPDRADAFRAAFNPLKIGPDLFALADQNRFKITDMFPANETHVSTAGYLMLGQRMLEAVREVLPAPAAKSP